MSNQITIQQDKTTTKYRWRYFLALMRPPNLITAASDILCGIAIAGIIFSKGNFDFPILRAGYADEVILLILSTCCLYGGGVVFNDVFDLSLDKIERPERPLPSGKVSLMEAVILGSLLLAGGILFAFLVNPLSGVIAIIIATLALLYDYKSKHNIIAGPINMGLCRAFNQCLGMSILAGVIGSSWFYSLIPFFYIIAITLISHGEVKGGNTLSLQIALVIYTGLIASVVITGIEPLPFVILWSVMIFPPLIKALRKGKAIYQRKAVKAGVLSVILMDASIAAIYAGLFYPCMMVLLLPLSIFIAKKFSVT